LSTQSRKLTFVPDQEELGLGKHAGQEVVARADLLTELALRVDGRVDLAPDAFLCPGKGIDDFGE
jgi:hypothetical protein